MTRTFITFKTFSNVKEAKEVKRFLSENNVTSLLRDNFACFENPKAALSLNEYELQVKAVQMDTAVELLEIRCEKMIEQVGSEHHLFSCTNGQLYDILVRKGEVSEFDHKLAKRLLAERGKPTDNQFIENIKVEKQKLKARPQINQMINIFAGYLLAILGGFAGIVIGYLMWSSQKQLPNGVTLYSHTESERRHGKIIFGIGILIFAYLLSIRIFDIPT